MISEKNHRVVPWHKVVAHAAFWLLFAGCIASAVPRISLTFSCQFGTCLTERTCGWAAYQVANSNPIYSQQYLQGPYANAIAYAPVYFYCTGLVTKCLCFLTGWNTFFTALNVSRIFSLTFAVLSLLIISDLCRRGSVPRPWCFAPLAVFALNPEAQRYVSECRNDTLAMCLELILVWCAVAMRPGWVLAIAVAVFGAAAVFTRQTAIVGWIAAVPVAVAAHDRRKWLGRGWLMAVALASLILAVLLWHSDGAAWLSLFGSQGKLPWYPSHLTYSLHWAAQSHVLKLSLVATVALLVASIRRPQPLATAALYTYTVSWALLACLLNGKVGAECNYFMPAMAGLAGGAAIGMYHFFTHASWVPRAVVAFVLVACMTRDILFLPRTTVALWKRMVDQDREIREFAHDLLPYHKVLSRYSDILCSQDKPVFLVDYFTIRMLTVAGWYQPDGIYQAVSNTFYDAALLDAAPREKKKDENTMFWLPGLALDTLKHYRSAGIRHGGLVNPRGTILIPRTTAARPCVREQDKCGPAASRIPLL